MCASASVGEAACVRNVFCGEAVSVWNICVCVCVRVNFVCGEAVFKVLLWASHVCAQLFSQRSWACACNFFCFVGKLCVCARAGGRSACRVGVLLSPTTRFQLRRHSCLAEAALRPRCGAAWEQRRGQRLGPYLRRVHQFKARALALSPSPLLLHPSVKPTHP